MLCDRCIGREDEHQAQRRRHGRLWRVDTCDRCGSAILGRTGVSVRNSGEHLARLAQFGLVSSGNSLLDGTREDP